jgi:preprotein translocase subunit SecE
MESPAKFIREVRAETMKVTWPSRKETFASTAMVLFLIVLAGLFFWVVDSVISFIVAKILGFGA